MCVYSLGLSLSSFSGVIWTTGALRLKWFGLSAVHTLNSLSCCASPPSNSPALHGASLESCAVGYAQALRPRGGCCHAVSLIRPPVVRGAGSGASIPSSWPLGISQLLLPSCVLS